MIKLSFKNLIMVAICQDGKLAKRWFILQITRWSQITLSFDGSTSKYQEEYSNIFPGSNFQVPMRLATAGRIGSSTRIFMYYSRQ